LQVHSQLPPLAVVQLLQCYSQLGAFPQGSHDLLAALLQQLAGHVASLQNE
jgi:hypothetical protein